MAPRPLRAITGELPGMNQMGYPTLYEPLRAGFTVAG